MTPRPCALRAVTLADVAILAALHADGSDEPWSADAFARLLVLPGTVGRLAIVASAKGPLPAGFVLARCAGGEAEILTINVAKDWRRRGVGRALLDAGIAAVGDAARLLLEVAEGNEPALALYRGIGFAPVGRRIGYYARAEGRREDALIMALPIDTAVGASSPGSIQSTVNQPKG